MNCLKRSINDLNFLREKRNSNALKTAISSNIHTHTQTLIHWHDLGGPFHKCPLYTSKIHHLIESFTHTRCKCVCVMCECCNSRTIFKQANSHTKRELPLQLKSRYRLYLFVYFVGSRRVIRTLDYTQLSFSYAETMFISLFWACRTTFTCFSGFILR